MLNSQQNIMPYATEMVNDLPQSSSINNASIPALAPNMLTPMNNKESFMPTNRNMQGSYKRGGGIRAYAEGGQMQAYSVPKQPMYAHSMSKQPFKPYNYQELLNEYKNSNNPFKGRLAPGNEWLEEWAPNIMNALGGGSLMGNFAEGGGVGLEALLSQMSPEELQELMMQHQGNQQQMAQEGSVDGQMMQQNNLPNWSQDDGQIMPQYYGEEENRNLPHYGIGGVFKKAVRGVGKGIGNVVKGVGKGVGTVVKGAAKVAVPVIGGIVGNVIGGPVGGAIGAGLGAKLVGGKKSNRNAIIAGIGGYALSGGLGSLGGVGNVMNKITPKALSGAFGKGAAAAIPAAAGKAGAGAAVAAANAPAAGGLLGGAGLSNLLLPIAIGGTLLGKRKVPKEQPLNEVMNEMKGNWGPGKPGRKIKPLSRVQNILGKDAEGKFFDVVNPDTEYYADGGGYLHGHSSGQEDDINAKLSSGEYVLSADVVSRLGDGNNLAGAKKLDMFMRKVRTHTNSKEGKLSPKSKGIEAYLSRSA